MSYACKSNMKVDHNNFKYWLYVFHVSEQTASVDACHFIKDRVTVMPQSTQKLLKGPSTSLVDLGKCRKMVLWASHHYEASYSFRGPQADLSIHILSITPHRATTRHTFILYLGAIDSVIQLQYPLYSGQGCSAFQSQSLEP